MIEVERSKLDPVLHAQLADLGLLPRPSAPVSSTIEAGRGVCVIGSPSPPGDLIFGHPSNDLGAEHLRFKPDGTILVHGRVITKDADVADAVRGWAGLLPNSPLKIAARMLDRRSFRVTVWDSPLWGSTKHGPCGVVGDMSDVMDERLMAIRVQTEFFSHPDDRRAAFEERALEIDTACAKWNRAGVCDYTRAALEVEHGRDWRSASWPACVKCGAKHPEAAT